MTGGDEYKVVFDVIANAGNDLHKTAEATLEQAGDQVRAMVNTLGAGWGDQGAEAALQQYQYQMKQTNAYTDSVHAEGGAYNFIDEDAQSTLGQVLRIVG